jgi:hypothetical protein
MTTYLAYLQFTLYNNIANIMVLDINVLYLIMKHLIFSKVRDTLTIRKQINAKIISTKLSMQTFIPSPQSWCGSDL